MTTRLILFYPNGATLGADGLLMPNLDLAAVIIVALREGRDAVIPDTWTLRTWDGVGEIEAQQESEVPEGANEDYNRGYSDGRDSMLP